MRKLILLTVSLACAFGANAQQKFTAPQAEYYFNPKPDGSFKQFNIKPKGYTFPEQNEPDLANLPKNTYKTPIAVFKSTDQMPVAKLYSDDKMPVKKYSLSINIVSRKITR